jgi:hypothetical protein
VPRDLFLRRNPEPPGALAVESSDNRKLGCCSATYVSQESCPSCPLRGAGCYAEHDLIQFVTWRLGRAGALSPARLALAEARAIDRLTGDRPLRLHVVGDCRTPRAAGIVAAAAARYQARGGRPVWTYTHAWRTVPRAAWGEVSVLASCESAQQAAEAMAQGYAAALLVDEYPSEAAYNHGGVRVLPCPYQTRGVQCRDCRLCFGDTRLLKAGLVIGFAVHGSGAALARHALPVL